MCVCACAVHPLCMCVHSACPPAVCGSLPSVVFCSLDVGLAASPSDHHRTLHSDAVGIISCDLDVICSKKSPQDAIKSLFFNAYSALIRILKTCFCCIKAVALDAVHMQQVNATEDEVKQAQDLRALFQCLEIDKKWNYLHFLDNAITNLPPEASKEREAAQVVLGHYKSHLRAYIKATSIKEGKSVLGHPPRKRGREERLVVTEITVDKEMEDYTCKDCLDLWIRFLVEALDIPEDNIQFCNARHSNSTTLVFLVPQTFAEEIKEKLSNPAVIWIIKQLGILRVHVVGIFNNDLREALPVIPTDSVREGLQSGVDFVLLTKVWVCACTYICVSEHARVCVCACVNIVCIVGQF